MNQNSRTKNSAINIIVSIACQVSTLALSFLVRTIFINLLGADYLGINGLFGNIFSFLSLSSLGISAIITFALYKPIARNDIKKIQAYMKFFKFSYRIIALIVFFLGCAFIPFLGYLVNVPNNIPHINLIYFLMLINTASTYLCVYKTTLMIADQRIFVTKIIATIGVVLANILELLILVFTHNFIGYLIMQLVSTWITNIITSLVADKYYPFLRNNHEKLNKSEKKDILNGVKAIIIFTLAGFVLNSTDNILISVLVSTTMVGYYSNYTLITGAVAGFANLILEAIKGSIGSLTASENIENSKRNFKTLSLFNFWLYCLISLSLLFLLNDFIVIWIGPEYVLPNYTVLVIVLNIFVQGSMMIIQNYRDTTGLYKKTKFVHMFAAAINIVLSILFGFWFGITGILVATCIARLCTSVWYEPKVVFRDYFKESVRGFITMEIKYLCVTIITGVILYFVLGFLPTGNILFFIIKLVCCVTFINLLLFIVFFKTSEFKDLLDKIKALLKRKT